MRKFGFAAVCAVLMGIAATGFGYSFDEVVVEYWAGSGVNEAMLVVDFLSGDNYAFGYRWTGSATGFDILVAVDGGGDFGFTYTDPGYGILVDTMSYDGHTMGTGGYLNNDWVGYFTSPDGDTWTASPGLCDWGSLTDGSWDGWAHQTTGVFPPANKPTTPIVIAGDANKDGLVDIQDFDILKYNFGKDPAVWTDGNFNEDTLIDIQDFDILKAHFGEHSPEPATLGLVGLGAWLALLRRRRKWR